MALTIKNNNSFELSDNLTNFFSLPNNNDKEDNYDNLKSIIYTLDLDNEEKANILNKISLLNTTTSIKEKNKLKKEINSFRDLYNI